MQDRSNGTAGSFFEKNDLNKLIYRFEYISL
jgi:hypothetical protein